MLPCKTRSALQILEVVCHLAVLRAERYHTLDSAFTRRCEGTTSATVTLCCVSLYATNAQLPKMGTKKDGSLLLLSALTKTMFSSASQREKKKTYAMT